VAPLTGKPHPDLQTTGTNGTLISTGTAPSHHATSGAASASASGKRATNAGNHTSGHPNPALGPARAIAHAVERIVPTAAIAGPSGGLIAAGVLVLGIGLVLVATRRGWFARTR
jgi:hypothetical protein